MLIKSVVFMYAIATKHGQYVETTTLKGFAKGIGAYDKANCEVYETIGLAKSTLFDLVRVKDLSINDLTVVEIPNKELVRLCPKRFGLRYDRVYDFERSCFLDSNQRLTDPLRHPKSKFSKPRKGPSRIVVKGENSRLFKRNTVLDSFYTEARNAMSVEPLIKVVSRKK